MTAIQTPFGSQAGKYSFMGSMKLLNTYVELLGEGGKSKYGIIDCDGLVEFANVTDTPIRGGIFMEDLDYLYTAHSSYLYKTDSAGTVTNVGVLPGIDQVEFTRNQKSTPQIVVKTNVGTYCIENDIITPISDVDLPTVISVTYLNGYVIYIIRDGRFFWSGVNEATTINGLDFATAEQRADRNKRGFAIRGELLLMGENTIEFWRPTGNADLPFKVLANAVIPVGLLAQRSVVQADKTLFCISSDKKFSRLNNYGFVQVSNHEVERLIEGDDEPENITATAWVKDGHEFINLTGSNWSKCYDVKTGEWHDRQSYLLDIWRARYAFPAFNKIIVGDTIGGKLFYLDSEAYTEDDDTFIRGWDAPIMQSFPDGGIVDALFLDVETGRGAVLSTAQGYDPVGMLSWSNDGGVTFPIERQLPLGRSGVRETRVKTRRLGRYGPKGRVWRWRVSDPVPMGLSKLDAKVRPLKAL